MKKYNVVVQLLAQLDVREARQWYNRQQAGLGKRFTADMAMTFHSIARNPEAFAIRYQDVRAANFRTFPYAAYFFIDQPSATVFIMAILHASRHPDTPKGRQ